MEKTGICKDGRRIVIFLDEISNMVPFHLALLHLACQQAMECSNKPFGGVVVVFMGDLYQLELVMAGRSQHAQQQPPEEISIPGAQTKQPVLTK